MTLLKNIAWALLFTFMFKGLLNAQQKIVSYKDTVYEQGDYIFKFSHSYSKLLFFKTTLQLTNNSDKFVIFPADYIYAKTGKSEKSMIHPQRNVVAAPGHTIKYAMRFNGVKFTESRVYFHIDKAQIADQKIGRYEPFEIRALPDAVASVGNIRITILSAHHGKNYYKLKIKIQNLRKENFLAINFPKIYIKTVEGDVVYHKPKKNQRLHYEDRDGQDVTYLVFHIGDDFKTDNRIYFDDVFTEYYLKDIPGYKFEATFNSVTGPVDSKAIEKKEKEEEKEERKEEH